MARGKGLGKTIVLLFLVVILILIGLMWFDYLGVVNAKKIFAPVYKLFGLVPQTSVSITNNDPVLMSNLEDDRIEKRLEALEIRAQELDKREEELKKLEEQNLQISQELDDLRKSQEEREKTFNNTVKKYDDREVNIVQNAKNLTGMPPESAVAILNAMEDQDVIDTLRKVEEIAQEEGTMSMVAYWLSLMPADLVATIQRKMVSKPKTLE